MLRLFSLLFVGIGLTTSFSANAQYGSFGQDTCPADSVPVDDIIYYGEMLDMSNGYQVGDTVFDFTVYDFDGTPLNLYDELSGQKPVVLINGSVSCLRFRGTFEPDNNGQQYVAARNYLESHADDVNWIFIYGVEAHPTDGNCPSNCPPTVSNDTTVVQPPYYLNRRWAVNSWEQSPEHDFPFTMYADNQDNAVYNNFFQRPFGMLAVNCDGTVALRGDWVNSFFMDSGNVAELNAWRSDSNTCSIEWTPEEDANEDESNSTDDDSTDDDSTDDDSTDDDSTDDDSADDDSADDDSTDDDSSDDDNPTYDGPSAAIGGGTNENESASNIFREKPLEMLVYPNPAQEFVQIEGLKNEAQLQLIDQGGRIILDLQTAQKALKIDVSGYTSGQYILLFQQEDSRPQRKVLIIQ